MSPERTNQIRDEQFLRAMHISTEDPGPHGECHRRWAEERGKREAAERHSCKLSVEVATLHDELVKIAESRTAWRTATAATWVLLMAGAAVYVSHAFGLSLIATAICIGMAWRSIWRKPGKGRRDA